MAGQLKVNGVTLATESSGTVTLENPQIKDSSNNLVLDQSGSKAVLKNVEVVNDSPLMFRNLLYNGAMQINQRGTVSVTSGNAYGCDRWEVATVGGSAQYDLSQSTDVPAGKGFAKSFHIDITTADASLGASDGYFFRQQLEGQDLQRLMKGTSGAKTLTLSFFVKSSLSGTYIVELYDIDNARQVSRSYSISTADTWQEVILNFPADTIGAFDNDNARSLIVAWWLASGTDKTSGTLNTNWNSNVDANRLVGLNVNVMDNTSNNFYITGVQLEIGNQATPFEHRLYGMELGLCERYYETMVFGASRGITCQARSANDTNGWYSFRTRKRAIPTASTSGTFGAFIANSSTVAATLSFSSTTVDGVGLDVLTSGMVAGNASLLVGNTSGSIILTAEL